MKIIFKVLPFTIIAVALLFFGCEKDQDVMNESKVDVKTLNVIGKFVEGDSIRQANKSLDVFLRARFERDNSLSAENITSNMYGFTIDTNRVLQLVGDTYTNYIFSVYRPNQVTTTILENYMLTVFDTGDYMQVLVAYPMIDTNGILEPSVIGTTLTYINDVSLLTGAEMPPCASLADEIIGWDISCVDVNCTAGGDHSYGEPCNGSPSQQPSRICTGGWVTTGCMTSGGSPGTSPINEPVGGGQNTGDPNNDPNNDPIEEVPIVPLVPSWQEVVNCMNGGNLGSNPLLSDTQKTWLQDMGKDAMGMDNYLKVSGCDSDAKDFVFEAIETMILENISFEEFILRKVEDILEDNPLAFLEIDCDQIQHWQTLAQHTAPQPVLDKIDALPNSWANNFYIQELDNAGGTAVNMDYFGVKVTNLPMKPNSNPPARYTADEYLDYVRRNFNDFVDGSTFEPYCEFPSMCQTETDLWASSNPVGSIIYIDIPGDDGVVVCTQYANDYWYFVTMNAPYTGNHPVSGTRQFGYETNADGSYNFFVRGVDRYNNGAIFNIIDFFSSNPFFGADDLWESFQTKLKTHVNSNFGLSTDIQPTKNRPNWIKVKKVLKGELPISELGCN